MKSPAIATFLFGLSMAPGLGAQEFKAELPVYANMDIYRAGGYEDGSDGIAPTMYSFPPGKRALVFASVTGSWTCNFGFPAFTPDGTTAAGCNPLAVFGPVGNFSGYADTDFSSALVGMFLTGEHPGYIRPPLRFYFNDASEGGIKTDFASLAPKIGQVFYIGDGLTGTGIGRRQVFFVPFTATHLYLGFIGSCNPADLNPSCYSDNAGTLTTVFGLYKIN